MILTSLFLLRIGENRPYYIAEKGLSEYETSAGAKNLLYF